MFTHMLVTIQLPESSEITEMDDSLLEKITGTDENDDAIFEWIEYRLNGATVHRSVHAHLKRMPAIFPTQGDFNG
jgi:hypothetical protein